LKRFRQNLAAAFQAGHPADAYFPHLIAGKKLRHLSGGRNFSAFAREKRGPFGGSVRAGQRAPSQVRARAITESPAGLSRRSVLPGVS
jgi:hypothetical protein